MHEIDLFASRTLKKIMVGKVEAILIVPLWPTECWYQMALNLLVIHPLIFQSIHQYIYLTYKQYTVQEIPRRAQELIFNSWRPSTRSKYAYALAKWEKYCGECCIDLLNFLVFLFYSGLSYSTVHLNKSALAYSPPVLSLILDRLSHVTMSHGILV